MGAAVPRRTDFPFPELEETTIGELQAKLADGELTAEALVAMYLARIDAIDRQGPGLRSILQTNPDAPAIAAALDRERAARGPRGPLHGIPILLKDNIDTADRMETTAGSLALLGVKRVRDAFVAARLRQAGAVLLGKTNLSEWANYRSPRSSSGWSARGGQCRNPYRLDRSPGGSSSGSGAAIAANLGVVALGTETDGSILSPATANGIVGIKPTVGLTSRAGVIPIAHSQDTVGPMARTVADAAIVLGAIAGRDPRDPLLPSMPQLPVGDDVVERDYASALSLDGLRGARLGVPRDVYWGYSEKADAVAETALAVLREQGATLVDPAHIPTAHELSRGWPPADDGEATVLSYEFHADLDAYLSGLGPAAPVRSLAELIAFNEGHRDQELPYFGQETFHQAVATGPLTDPTYLAALERNHRLSRDEGIDVVLDEFRLDALVMPTANPPGKIDLVNGECSLGSSSKLAALAGYPAITVPAGFIFGLPVGITFIGRAYSEATLIRLAYAYEQASRARRPPRFLPPSVEPEGD